MNYALFQRRNFLRQFALSGAVMRIARVVASSTVLLCALLNSGCLSIIDSYQVSGPDAVDPRDQASGSYFLPKHLVHVEVAAGALTVSAIPVQDNLSQLQTGFALSAFADDDIAIVYEAGLLKTITASATDRTGDVIVQIAKDVAALRAAKIAAPASAPATFDFDPFNFVSASQTNAQLLRQYNSCVEVELAPNFWSPGCGRYSLGSLVVKAEAFDDFLAPFPQVAPGIYYRRPIAHRVHVVEKGRTKEITSKPFANFAPVFKIDINRTLFVKRKTTVNFVDGVPTGVNVVKDSEALAVAKLPLDVLNAVISAPVDALVQRKALVDAQTNLTTAQKNNLDANTELIKAGAAQASATNTVPVTGLTRTALISSLSGNAIPTREQCLDANIADYAFCQQLVRAQR